MKSKKIKIIMAIFLVIICLSTVASATIDLISADINNVVSEFENQMHTMYGNETNNLINTSLTDPNELLDEIKNNEKEEVVTAVDNSEKDRYIASDYYELKETVVGNVFIAATEAKIKKGSKIVGNLFVSAEKVSIEYGSEINGSVFLLAPDMYINGTISETLYAIGKNVELGEKTQVGWDVRILAEKAKVEGLLYRNVYVCAGELEVTNKASIKYNIEYIGGSNYKIDKYAVEGTVVVRNLTPTKDIGSLKMIFYIMALIMTLITSLIITKCAPNFKEKARTDLEKKPVQTALIGILSVFLIPLVGVLLLLPIFTIPFTFVLFFIYMAIAILASSVFTVTFANLIKEKTNVIKGNNNTIILVALVTVIELLKLIPYFGMFISLIIYLIGFGIIIKAFLSKKEIKKVEETKTKVTTKKVEDVKPKKEIVKTVKTNVKKDTKTNKDNK